METRDPAGALATSAARRLAFVAGVAAPLAGAIASLALAVPLGVTRGGLSPLLAAGAFVATFGSVARVRSRSPRSVLAGVLAGEASLLAGSLALLSADESNRIAFALIGAGTLVGTLLGHALGARVREGEGVPGVGSAGPSHFEVRREAELESNTRGWQRPWISRRYWRDDQLEHNIELDRRILLRHGYDVTSPDETAQLEGSAHLGTRLFRLLVDANDNGVRVAFIRRGADAPDEGEPAGSFGEP